MLLLFSLDKNIIAVKMTDIQANEYACSSRVSEKYLNFQENLRVCDQDQPMFHVKRTSLSERGD
jgi:hypothetical protein